MSNAKNTNTMETQKAVILNFLKAKTRHNAETAKIRKSPAPQWDYVVRVQTHNGEEVKVNFNFEGGELAYGIAGWGVCTVVDVKDFI